MKPSHLRTSAATARVVASTVANPSPMAAASTNQNNNLKFSKFSAPFGERFGPGGRQSVSGITATVFGSYGFLGRYVCSELGSRGTTCFAPFRGCELEVRTLKPMFDLGQLALMPFSPKDEKSIYESVKRSNVVINLIGKDNATHHVTGDVNYSLEETLVNVPRRVARIAKKAGVSSFIHVSALAANPNSSSEWSRMKALGEQAVRAEFPEAIIVRPATLFGHEDKFLNRVALALEHAPFIPMLNHGVNKIQPVNVCDVSAAIHLIMMNCHEFSGHTFELAGPDVYSYREIVEFVADLIARPAFMVDTPLFAWKLAAATPIVNGDILNRMIEDNILVDDGTKFTFADLGMTPTSIENEAFDFLHQYRSGGHFRQVEGYYSTEQERVLRDVPK